VHLVAGQPIGGGESLDRTERFVLEALSPLELRFLGTNVEQQPPDQAADRSVLFGGPDPGAAVDIVWQ